MSTSVALISLSVGSMVSRSAPRMSMFVALEPRTDVSAFVSRATALALLAKALVAAAAVPKRRNSLRVILLIVPPCGPTRGPLSHQVGRPFASGGRRRCVNCWCNSPAPSPIGQCHDSDADQTRVELTREGRSQRHRRKHAEHREHGRPTQIRKQPYPNPEARRV